MTTRATYTTIHREPFERSSRSSIVVSESTNAPADRRFRAKMDSVSGTLRITYGRTAEEAVARLKRWALGEEPLVSIAKRAIRRTR